VSVVAIAVAVIDFIVVDDVIDFERRSYDLAPRRQCCHIRPEFHQSRRHRPILGAEIRKSAKQPVQIESVREPFLLTLAGCDGDRFHRRKLCWLYHPYAPDLAERGQLWNLTYVHEMSIFRFAELIDAEPSRNYLANTHGDPEPNRNHGSDILGKLGSLGAEQVDIGRHPFGFAIRVDRVGAEDHGVLTCRQEQQDLAKDRCQGYRFVRHEFSKRERSIGQQHN
jgi:hypothetical protein